MSTPKAPDMAKLIIGFFTNDRSIIDGLIKKLTFFFGSVERKSDWMPFDYTTYYQKEMGEELYRKLLSFVQLIPQEELALIKLKTSEIEKYYENQGSRRVNIDPGYLLSERFVLATGKNYSHRIYIGHGIYADLTLLYTQGKFMSLPWTYPDYQGEAIQRFLLLVREDYIQSNRTKKDK